MLRRAADAIVGVTGHNRELVERGSAPPPAPFSAPRTSLNGNLSSRRRFATVEVPFDDVKLVRRAFGGTVNDVLLAAIAGAVRDLLEERGERPDGPLVGFVPVSTRPGGAGRSGDGASPDSAADVALGNRVSAMLVSLATDVDDPVERLRAIAAAAAAAKAQEALLGGELLEDLAKMAVPAVSARVVRWAAGLRLFDRLPPMFNLVASTMPGPDFDLWCAAAGSPGCTRSARSPTALAST